MRQRPAIRTKMRFDPPPKDGSTIIVSRSFELRVYWDRELRQWILERPLSVETLDTVIRWRRVKIP